jgi:hypothetical protein
LASIFCVASSENGIMIISLKSYERHHVFSKLNHLLLNSIKSKHEAETSKRVNNCDFILAWKRNEFSRQRHDVFFLLRRTVQSVRTVHHELVTVEETLFWVDNDPPSESESACTTSTSYMDVGRGALRRIDGHLVADL